MCSAAFACGRAPSDALALPFAGPGRLALLWEVPTPSGESERALVVYGPEGLRRLALPAANSLRFAGPQQLLLALDVRSEAADDWGQSQLALLELDTGALHRFGDVRRWLDPEPAADTGRLAVAVQVNEKGDSDLELWSLAPEPERLTAREESLDEPRFSPDGFELVVARSVQGAGSEGPSFGGIEVPLPRLFRLRHDLFGRPRAISDGERPGAMASSGSLPLWWGERGIFARQGSRLVRCAPAGGCAVLWEASEEHALADARPLGNNAALLLLVDREHTRERLANELRRIDLATGAVTPLLDARPDYFILDADWHSSP